MACNVTVELKEVGNEATAVAVCTEGQPFSRARGKIFR